MPSRSSLQVHVSELQNPGEQVTSGLHGQPSVPHGHDSSPIQAGGGSGASVPLVDMLVEPDPLSVVPEVLDPVESAVVVPVVLESSGAGGPHIDTQINNGASVWHRTGSLLRDGGGRGMCLSRGPESSQSVKRATGAEVRYNPM